MQPHIPLFSSQLIPHTYKNKNTFPLSMTVQQILKKNFDLRQSMNQDTESLILWVMTPCSLVRFASVSKEPAVSILRAELGKCTIKENTIQISTFAKNSVLPTRHKLLTSRAKYLKPCSSDGLSGFPHPEKNVFWPTLFESCFSQDDLHVAEVTLLFTRWSARSWSHVAVHKMICT